MKRHGLGRDERVRSRRDFVRVQTKPGARVRAKTFLVLLSLGPGDGGGPARLGLVASRKVGGAAGRWLDKAPFGPPLGAADRYGMYY